MSRTIPRALLLAVVACVVAVVVAPSASAINPAYAQFAGCPDDPSVVSCFRADTRAGHIKIGSTDTPINKTQTISGGLVETADPTRFNLAYNSQGGLTGDPLEVPGGLAGLTGLSEFILNLITFGANKVYAKPVPVGQIRLNTATFETRIPMKVNLINPFLRSGCSIGSASSPIILNLITGTTAPPPPNTPISGHGPTGFGDPDPEIVGFQNIKLVDNSFAAPTASSSCDLIGFGLISGLINSRVGLPSAAGRNEAIFDQTNVRLVNPLVVYP